MVEFPSSRRRIPPLLMLSLVILGGFGLRTFRLDAQSLWWDEGFSLHLAGQTLRAIVLGDFHPPLYHLLLAGWIRLAGPSDFAARYLSVISGTLLIPLTWCLGRRLFDPLTGCIAALLAATSPVLLWYSQETRMYILAALIYLTLIYLFHRLTDPRSPSATPRLWFAFGIVELAGLYTHYFIALGILWLLLATLFRHHAIRTAQYALRNTHYTSLLLTQTLVALAYLPWLPVFLSLQGRYNPLAATPPSPATFLSQVWHGYNAGSLALVGHHSAFMFLSTAVGVLFIITLALSLIRDPKRSALLWLLAHTLLPLGAIFVLMQVRPFFHPRYVVMLAPPLLVLIARALRITHYALRSTPYALRITHYAPLFLPLTLLSILLLTFTTATYTFTTDPRYQRDDLRGLARYLAATAGPRDAIVFGYVDYPFQRYYTGPAPATYLDLSRPDGMVAQTLAAKLRGRERAFLVTWNQAPVDRRGLLRWLLASAGRQVEAQRWGDLTIHTYALERPVPVPALVPQAADFGWVRLAGSQLPASMPSAGAVPVALEWAASQVSPADFKAALRLRDAVGHVLAQTDILLVDRRGEPTTRWTPDVLVTNYAVLTLPLGTPPGSYTVDLVVYDAGTLRRLDRQDVPGQRVELGRLQLTFSNAEFRAATLPGFTPVGATLGGLSLDGYAVDRSEVGPGGQISVALRWRVVNTPPNTAPALRLVAANGATLAQAGEPLYPPSAWQPGQVVLDWRDLRLPPDVPVGPATLQVTATDRTHALTDITITAVDRRFTPPPMTYSLRARFGNVAELLGYDLDTSARAGDPVKLTLYWRALGDSEISYTVFTHLLDETGRLVGQHDGVPAGGQRPTTGWLKDEIIIDPHLMTWKESDYIGTARVEIGLYDPTTNQRLTTDAGADYLILPVVVEVASRGAEPGGLNAGRAKSTKPRAGLKAPR